MNRPGIVLLILVALAVGAGGILYGVRGKSRSAVKEDQLRFLEQRVELLEEENVRLLNMIDRLERAGAVDDPEAVIRSDLEQVVSRLRGREWVRRPHYKIVTEDGVADLLREKVRGRPAEAETARRRMVAWEAMGWIGEGFEWWKMMGHLFDGTASAFFDVESRVLNVARGAALEEANERVLLVHELMYAMQDQHHDLTAYLLPTIDQLWRNSDQELARHALVVGDACVTALQYNANFGSPLVAVSGQLREFGARAAMTGVPSDGEGVKERVPDAIEMLTAFPHASGRAFCSALLEGTSFVEIDEAYERPPESTTEVLHVKLYREGKFRPRRFAWKEEDFRLRGREILWSDVAGEFGTGVLLRRYLEKEEAEQGAAGWKGDRYIVWGEEGAEGRATDVLWRSEWENAKEAEAFLAALGEFTRARYDLKDRLAGSYDGERYLLLERTGNGTGVIFVDAETAKRREEIREKLP